MSLWGEKEMVQRESFADEGSGKEKASLWRAVTGFPSGSKRHQVTLFNPSSELSQAQNLQVGSKLKYMNVVCSLLKFVDTPSLVHETFLGLFA